MGTELCGVLSCVIVVFHIWDVLKGMKVPLVHERSNQEGKGEGGFTEG